MDEISEDFFHEGLNKLFLAEFQRLQFLEDIQ